MSPYVHSTNTVHPETGHRYKILLVPNGEYIARFYVGIRSSNGEVHDDVPTDFVSCAVRSCAKGRLIGYCMAREESPCVPCTICKTPLVWRLIQPRISARFFNIKEKGAGCLGRLGICARTNPTYP